MRRQNTCGPPDGRRGRRPARRRAGRARGGRARDGGSGRGSSPAAAVRAPCRSTRDGTGRPSAAAPDGRGPSPSRRPSTRSAGRPRGPRRPAASGSGPPRSPAGSRRTAATRRGTPALIRPWTASGARTTTPPLTCARPWCPRQTPRIGRSGVASASAQIPKSPGRSGVPGPGEMTTLSKPSPAQLLPRRRVVAHDDGLLAVDLGDQLEEVVGVGVVVVDDQRLHAGQRSTRAGYPGRRRCMRGAQAARCSCAIAVRSAAASSTGGSVATSAATRRAAAR